MLSALPLLLSLAILSRRPHVANSIVDYYALKSVGHYSNFSYVQSAILSITIKSEAIVSYICKLVTYIFKTDNKSKVNYKKIVEISSFLLLINVIITVNCECTVQPLRIGETQTSSF